MSQTVTITQKSKQSKPVNKNLAFQPSTSLNNVNQVTDSRKRVRIITKCILNEEAKARRQYPLLNHQNFLGLTIFLSSVIAILTFAHLYLSNVLPWYFTIPLIAFPVSLLHELEHDLIHNLYFKKHKFMQDLMFSVIWLFKFHSNPWWRKTIHLLHHQVSGQSGDVEERLIGLGMNLDYKRLGVTTHPLGFFNELKGIKKAAGEKLNLAYMNRANMATAFILLLCVKAFPVVFGLKFFLGDSAVWSDWGLETVFGFVRDFMVIVGFPLFLRQSCLVGISTGSHYYGDIPKRDVFFQNQILDHWLLTPLQVFCFWFGSSHVIHHYIPNQPFYLRPIIQSEVHKVMIECGVRKNDWGVIKRANRWNRNEEKDNKEFAQGIMWFLAVFVASFFYCFIWDVFIGTVGLKVVSLFFSYPIRKLIS